MKFDALTGRSSCTVRQQVNFNLCYAIPVNFVLYMTLKSNLTNFLIALRFLKNIFVEGENVHKYP